MVYLKGPKERSRIIFRQARTIRTFRPSLRPSDLYSIY